MRTRSVGVLALLGMIAGCAADAGEVGDGQEPSVIERTEAATGAAPVNCPPVTSTLDEHVAAKRATVTTVRFFIFTFKTYYSTGPLREQLGTTGTDVVTLYKVYGGYSSMVSDCQKCGNGVIDTDRGETCDGANLGGASCSSVDPALHGTLACDPWTCTFELTNCGEGTCGNGQLEPREDCDGNLFRRGSSCTRNPDYVGGVITCTGSCTEDVSACIGRCGNGVIDPGEECDGSARSASYAGKSCRDLPNPRHAWPFDNVVNWAGGQLTCNSCKISTSSCEAAPGCYMPLGAPLGIFPVCS